MNTRKQLLNIFCTPAALALAAFALTSTPAHANTVWNVNMGTQLTTSDNYVGAAFENTPNSTWNLVATTPQTGMALADSTGSSSAGVTLDLSGASVGYPGVNLSIGDKIFYRYLGSSATAMTIKGLSPSGTYDVVIYSDWWWKNGTGYPVTQTVGTGLAGTIYVNRILGGTDGTVLSLTEDTNPANVTSGAGNVGNWYRIKGLTPNASGQLGFSLGGGSTNAPFNGFQLVKIEADSTPPTPNPMTWASAPAAAGETSITMIATTASDGNGVEYSFTETSGNPGATNSGWQNSPVYTDTGLTPATSYTYTVMARDKSPAQNVGTASAPASASTLAADVSPPTPNPLSFATPPAASSITTITMTATTASDPSGVEYYFTETSGHSGGSDSGWQDSPIYTDAGLTPGTSYTYKVKARDKAIAHNTTADSPPASATTTTETVASKVWNINIGNQVTTADNFVGAAAENTQNSTWNSVVNPLPKTAMALADSTGVSTAGVTLDLSAVQSGNPVTSIGGYALTSGDKIFYSCLGGGGTTITMAIKGLSMSKTYDVVIYSDWYWNGGDSGTPVTQTLGTGLAGTIYVNHDTTGANGIASPLTEDTNPADVNGATNWYRIKGLTPDANGQLGFRLGDGKNAPFSGFQLVDTTTLYSAWANGYLPANVSNKAGDNDGDTLTNLQEYAFGTNPTVSYSGPILYDLNGSVTTPGSPVASNFAVGAGVDYRAVFGRRKDYVAAGLTYTVQFSAGLDIWVNSAATPTRLTGASSTGDIDAYSVPYPLFIPTARGVEKPTFFRVAVSSN